MCSDPDKIAVETYLQSITLLDLLTFYYNYFINIFIYNLYIFLNIFFDPKNISNRKKN